MKRNKIIFKAGAKKSAVIINGFFIFLLIILIISVDTFAAFTLKAIITPIICAAVVYESIRLWHIKNNFLCIRDVDIFGISGKRSFMFKENFNIRRTDILNVYKRKNKLIIETSVNQYICLIEDADAALRILKSCKNQILNFKTLK